MNKLLTIIKREYMTRVRTKGFIISTLLMPLIILAVILIPALLGNLKSDEQRRISVVDLQGTFYDALVTELSEKNDKGDNVYLLERVDATAAALDTIKKGLLASVDADEIDGVLFVPSDVLEGNSAEYYAKNVSNFGFNRSLRNTLTQIGVRKRMLSVGIDPDKADALTKRVGLATFRVEEGGREEADRGQSLIVVMVLCLFLYIVLLIYGAAVLQAVAEEKSSRVVEVIISSVKPTWLMAGKIIGVGGVGLTQYIIWAVVAGLVSAYASAILVGIGISGEGAAAALPSIKPSLLFFFVLYFVLGFVLMACLYAAAAAAVNTQEEAQQMSLPITMLLVVPILLLGMIVENPTALHSQLLSYVPFFQPILMFARIAIQTPPWWEILLALGIMLGGIYVMLLIAGKIFRVGILMYGKRATFPEMLRWIRS